jgi:hypothetical protein
MARSGPNMPPTTAAELQRRPKMQGEFGYAAVPSRHYQLAAHRPAIRLFEHGSADTAR